MKAAIDKSGWSRGAWDSEPDLENFTTANGMAGAIIRVSHSGSLCGYVGVPASHPWHGKEYGAEVLPSVEQLSRPIDVDKISIISLFCGAGENLVEGARIDCLVDVHGGLTYSGAGIAEYGEDSALWYFGFDCAHSGDLSPAMDGLYPQFRICGETYRDIGYVRGEVESLAKQLELVSAPCAA
jgi:hypothetical protein